MNRARPKPRRAVALLLASFALLASWGAVTDSPTVDEPGHLAAGLAVLHTGDLRLSPDHPPLARLWLALPTWLSPHAWPGPEGPGWHDGDFLAVGSALLRANDPRRLLWPARGMAIALALLLCAATYGLARSLFGESGALLALILAAFDPTLLAHGHYVTTDVPVTLLTVLALWSWARLAQAASAARLLAAVLSLAALSLTKLTWPLVLPALVALGLWVSFRRAPLELRLGGLSVVAARPAKALAWCGLLGLALLAVWAAVWCCYGLRYSPFRGQDAATARMYTASDFGRPRPATMDEAWETVLHDPLTGRDRNTPLVHAVRFMRARRLLPEAYLYGLAFVENRSLHRSSYFMGENRLGGHWGYFVVAFLIKTPLATLLLLAAGVAALVTRRCPWPDCGLAVALGAFSVAQLALLLSSGLNIGQRHLLPLYPLLFVLAGAAVGWSTTRTGRTLLVVCATWVLGASLLAGPQQLGYFNELVGGWRHGHLYLADSNIDWGQDMQRLARWAAAHQQESLKLARFGDNVPLPRGFAPESLAGEAGLVLAPLVAGTYVVSVNELLGVYKPLYRASTWGDAGLRETYSRLWAGARLTSPAAQREFETLRRARLIRGLRERAPDERIGRSLLAFRLDAAAIEALTRP